MRALVLALALPALGVAPVLADGTPAPAADGTVTATRDAPPRTTGTSPRTTGTSPRTAGTSPRTTGTSPRTTGTSPRTAGTSPRTTGTSPRAADADSADPRTRRITLDVREADTGELLRFLARAGDVNLVLFGEPERKVTVRLRNVPWDQALHTVVRLAGLELEHTGNVVSVGRPEAFAAERERRRARSEAAVIEAPLETRLIRVSHARAADLLPLVKETLTERGRATVDERTNTIIVTDVAPAE